MSTTIQVSRRVARILRELMKRTGVETYDELIRTLINERYRIQESLFGSNPRIASFKEEEEAELHEL
ncbi:MAG: hypothetical protein QW176_03780 [Candidatus Bathyarchaeia archaeon]